jgi:two-component system, OmpR family, sensor histidine kinase KdpD
MVEIKPSQIARIALKTALGSLAISLITFLCFWAHLEFAFPMSLFLVVVVAESLWGGFASAAIVSVAAVASLDYFFIPPIFEWRNDPKDSLALLTYLATSLVITRLASKAQNEARAAERRRRDVTLLYDAASRLLSLDPEMAAGPEALLMFRQVFGLRAACCFDAESGRLQIEGESRNGLDVKTRDACIEGSDHRDRENELYIRNLHTEGKVTGAVGFEGRIEDDSVALALTLLSATAMERVRAFRSANKAAADAQAEMLRSAIVDAFAHGFKTPLAIILAASGGLRETCGPRDEQVEMVEIIENQTLHLSQLTTRLLRMARLDRDDVKPRMEATSLRALIERLIDQSRSQFGSRISMRPGRGDPEVMAEPELLSLAMTQLLDNACKYSSPGSTVAVELDATNGYAEVRVGNEGSSIRPEERDRIFERFFRGAETERATPGAGLGLYVARKIVRAHGGLLELDRSHLSATSTTFQMRLPIVQNERQQKPQTDQSAGSGR